MAHGREKDKEKAPRFKRYAEARIAAKQGHNQRTQMVIKANQEQARSLAKMANDSSVSARDRVEAGRRLSRLGVLQTRQLEHANNDFQRANNRIDTKEGNFARSINKNMQRLESRYRRMGHGGASATRLARDEMKRRMGDDVEQFLPAAKRVRQDGYTTATYIENPQELRQVRQDAQRIAQSRNTNYVEGQKGVSADQRRKTYAEQVDRYKAAQEQRRVDRFGPRLTEDEAEQLKLDQESTISGHEKRLAEAESSDRTGWKFRDWKEGLKGDITRLRGEQAKLGIKAGMFWGQFEKRGANREQIRSDVVERKAQARQNEMMSARVTNKFLLGSGTPEEQAGHRRTVESMRRVATDWGQREEKGIGALSVDMFAAADASEKRHGLRRRLKGKPKRRVSTKYGPGAPAASVASLDTSYMPPESWGRGPDTGDQQLIRGTQAADLGFAQDDLAGAGREQRLIDKLLQVSDPDARGREDDDDFWDIF